MTIITISRQVGSLGDEISSTVAKNLNLDLVGPAEVHELAQSCDPEYRDACALYETEHRPGFFERLFFDQPSYKSLFEALTFEQASRGNVVLMGRGAQIVLHGMPGVMSVAVVAPEEIRIQRTVAKLNCTPEEAARIVRNHDREHLHLIRLVFDRDPRDWALYDLILNTSQLAVSAASEMVVQAVERMDRIPDEESIKEKLTNMALGKRIETLVRKKLSPGTARNVLVNADLSGVIRITGQIADKIEKEKVEKIASQYPGVTKVECDLKLVGLAYGL